MSASFVLILLAMLATLGVLILGVIQMFRGGDPRRSNRLMQARVGFQALVLILIFLFFAFGRG